MFLLWIILFFFLLLAWLLVAPVVLHIDTAKSAYAIYQPGVFTVRVLRLNGTLFLLVRILFYKKQFDLMQMIFKSRQKKKEKAKEKPKKEKKKKQKERKPFSVYRAAAARIGVFIKEFFLTWHVHELHANFDTGDYMINGIMVPVLSNINRENVKLQTNFEGINEFRLIISNRLINIILLTLKLLIDLKFKIRLF